MKRLPAILILHATLLAAPSSFGQEAVTITCEEGKDRIFVDRTTKKVHACVNGEAKDTGHSVHFRSAFVEPTLQDGILLNDGKTVVPDQSETWNEAATSIESATPDATPNTLLMRDENSALNATTFNGDLTGTATGLSGNLPVANGGTGADNASSARTNLLIGNAATQNITELQSITTQAGANATIVPGNLQIMTDHHVIQIDDNTNHTVWGPTYGLTPPKLADFTWHVQGSAVAYDTPNGLYMQSIDDTYMRILLKAAPTVPYKITFSVKAHGEPANWYSGGFLWRESGNDRIVVVSYGYGASNANMRYQRFNNTTGGFASTITNHNFVNYTEPPKFTQVEDNGVNRIVRFSHDGRTFHDFHSIASGDWVTADQVGLFIILDNSYPAGALFEHWVEE